MSLASSYVILMGIGTPITYGLDRLYMNATAATMGEHGRDVIANSHQFGRFVSRSFRRTPRQHLPPGEAEALSSHNELSSHTVGTPQMTHILLFHLCFSGRRRSPNSP